MTFGDIVIILAVVVVIVIAVMYHFGKKNYAKNLEAQSFINQYKTVTPILVIDKRFEKPTPHKAKVGPQILTLMCDKSIYDVLAVKKTVKVELAGIYISKIVGMNLEDKKKKSFGQKVSLWLKNNQPKQQ